MKNKLICTSTDDKLDKLLQEIWDVDSDNIYSLVEEEKFPVRYFWDDENSSEVFEEGFMFALQAIKANKPVYNVCCRNRKDSDFYVEMFFIAENKELETLLTNTLEEAKENEEANKAYMEQQKKANRKQELKKQKTAIEKELKQLE
jgi:hypothetical protein